MHAWGGIEGGGHINIIRSDLNLNLLVESWRVELLYNYVLFLFGPIQNSHQSAVQILPNIRIYSCQSLKLVVTFNDSEIAEYRTIHTISDFRPTVEHIVLEVEGIPLYYLILVRLLFWNGHGWDGKLWWSYKPQIEGVQI